MYVCGVCGAYATGTGGAEVGSAGTSAATAQQMQRAVPAANAVLATSAAISCCPPGAPQKYAHPSGKENVGKVTPFQMNFS